MTRSPIELFWTAKNIQIQLQIQIQTQMKTQMKTQIQTHGGQAVQGKERWRKGTTIVTGSYSRQYTHGQVLAAQENISLGKTALNSTSCFILRKAEMMRIGTRGNKRGSPVKQYGITQC